MKILFATPELAPWVKTGGLGDVAGALPAALRREGADVRVLAPYYPALRKAFPDAPVAARLPSLGPSFAPDQLRYAVSPEGVPLLLLECHAYYDRVGNPYLGPEGHDWLDNALRFGLLSRVAAWLGTPASPADLRCDLIHCNDWQTGLAPAYLNYLAAERARSVVTVHNLAFQGLFPRENLSQLGLPAEAWTMDGVEYHGHLSFLKAGLQFADAVTTVSPSYADEIRTDAEGMGMAGLLRYRGDAVTGILNGIDTQVWNPARDPLLAAHYSARNLVGKDENRRALQKEMGLPEDEDIPLIGVVSRLTAQKGLDLVPPLAAALAELPVQLAVLGSGDKALEQAFLDMAQRWPQRFAVRIGFDEGLAHRIEAGADMFLMPSRFEPCGLNQMYSLRYGTPPIVRATGGLADTVEDGVTGFVFRDAMPQVLLATVQRAATTWRDRHAWRRMQRTGMGQDWSWTAPARRYMELYGRILAAP